MSNTNEIILRDAGTIVGGYIVGGGQHGQTDELDASIENAAKYITSELGCKAVIRFNSDRRSGGAFVMDTSEHGMAGNCSIGIHGLLTWSDCCGLGSFDMEAVYRFDEHMKNNDPYDMIRFYAYVDLRSPDDPYPMQRSVLYEEESPRYASVDGACRWLKAKAEQNEAVKTYLDRCREFKAGRINNAYGKTVFSRLAGKVEARKRFLSGEKVYMYPAMMDPSSSKRIGLISVMPELMEQSGTKDTICFNTLVAAFKDRYCYGQDVAFYTATYTYN